MKKKILFIIWSFSYGGGAEKQLAGLVNGLNPEKYEIDIVEFFHTDLHIEKVNSNIHFLHPINDKINDTPLKRKIVNGLTYVFPAIIRKKYINKNYDYEISFNNLIPTFLLSNNKKSKKICFIHGSVNNLAEKKNVFLRFLQKIHFKKANKIVAISNGTKKSLEVVFPEISNKIEIINNGYNFDMMDEKSNKDVLKLNNKSESSFELLYCNRLDENKNPGFLIEVCKILKEKGYNFHLNILGDGELKNKLNIEIKKYNLLENVSIIGYVSNPYPYIRNTDIICLTSKSEGFSTFLIEGLHFGKPFVSTSGAVPDEIKDKNCGFISDDESSYADNVIELIEKKKEYSTKSKNCYNESKKYNINNQIKSFEKILKEV